MSPSKRVALRWSVRAAMTALAAGALVVPTVAVAQPLAAAATPASATAQAASLHQQVMSGTLLANHGVKAIGGLSQGFVVTTAKGSTQPLSTALPAGYGPADLASHYAITGGTGTATIAIIDAGVDPKISSDLATYRSTYGLPACTTANGCLKLINFNGGAQPAPQTSAQGRQIEEEIAVETSLDMDMASAACPACHLLEVSVPFTAGVSDSNTSTSEFAQATATAAAQGAKAVSISYGYTETAGNTSGTTLANMNKLGVAITVSTGDSGFNGGTHQDWPSDLPSVIAVGGTTLPASGAETAWTGGGSGCETAFARANGQPAAVSALCANHRAAADVSADADPNTGLAVFDTYAPSTGQPDNFIVVGGTSASAPYISGLFARAGVASTVNGPNTLYATSTANFHDVTSGSNQESQRCSSFPAISPKICTAAAGYDGPTGLGSPHGLGAF